jgi:hypothetical protein
LLLELDGGGMRRVIGLLALTLLLAACGGQDMQAPVEGAVQGTAQAGQVATSVQATQIDAACEALILNAYADKAFEQRAQLVGTTPRASLGAPRKLSVTACLQDFHTRLLDMMEMHQIDYQTFAAQGDETMTQAAPLVGAQDLADIKRDLNILREGTVPPSPSPAATSKP